MLSPEVQRIWKAVEAYSERNSYLFSFLSRVSPQFTVCNRQLKLGVGSGSICSTSSIVNETSQSVSVSAPGGLMLVFDIKY